MATPVETQPPEVAAAPPKWELAVPDDPAVEAWVQRFSQENRKSFQTQLDRARNYVAPAQEIFERAGLPRDLVYVALVESGFSPTARSHASAVGMWQFISSTGKRYGLEQNKWVDERRHPFKSARAAVDYLSFLYDTLGSWELALAAYNAGENGVQRALDQSGLKTFRELAENGYLPAETRDYVPKVLAAVKITRDARRYGFHFDPGHYSPKHETVTVPGGVKLAWLGKKAGIPEPALRDHNPELIKPVTPPGCSEYELCVPVGKGDSVLEVLAERALPNDKAVDEISAPAPGSGASGRAVVTSLRPDSRFSLKGAKGVDGSIQKSSATATALHKVKPGDTWSGLAKKYAASPEALAALNGMKVSRPIKAGQSLKVPARDTSTVAAVAKLKKQTTQKSADLTSNGKKEVQLARKPCQPVHYPVRQGDTLWSIAERFRISLDKLCAENELRRNQKLIPGDVLTICIREQETAYASKSPFNNSPSRGD